MLLRCEKRHFSLEYSNIQTSVPSLSWQIVVLFHTKLKQDCVLQAEATRTVTIPTVVSERILELLESLDQAEEGQQPGLLSGADAGMVVGGGQALGSTWSNGCGKRRLFSKLSSVVPSLSWQIVDRGQKLTNSRSVRTGRYIGVSASKIDSGTSRSPRVLTAEERSAAPFERRLGRVAHL